MLVYQTPSEILLSPEESIEIISTGIEVSNPGSGVQAVTRVNFYARASLICFGLVLAIGRASTSTVFSLSSSNNFDIWRSASGSRNDPLCENIPVWLAEPVASLSDLSSCISTTANDSGHYKEHNQTIRIACLF